MKLEASRRELLDLTLRNALLNYRVLKSRGVEVVDGDPAAILQKLVREGTRLPFVAMRAEEDHAERDEPDQETSDDTPGGHSPGLSSSRLSTEESAGAGDILMPRELEMYGAGDLPEGARAASLFAHAPLERDVPRAGRSSIALLTPCTPSDLRKRLLATYYTARTCIEEQGVNTLFLAVGMLTWYENDQSQILRRSPLVLIPVELERAGAGERFSLRATGEDPGGNLSLETLLLNDFGIVLPTLPEPENLVEDLDLPTYFTAVDEAVQSLPRWKVDPRAVALGFFSFNKYLMYRDLDERVWPEGNSPVGHPLLTALLGDGFREAEPCFGEQEPLDHVLTLSDLNTVIDADSSQLLAIEDVKQGRSLIIQGPPGTGKSQTITNLIAEMIGQGKRVLFVAEKMAALEVVKQRLDRLQLGSACLELHSSKANKKAVLQELKRTFDLGRPQERGREDDLALLTTARDRLNAYSEAVNAPAAKSGQTLHSILGEWLRLQREHAQDDVFEGLPELDMPGFAAWTPLDLRRREQLVQEMQTHLATMGAPALHPYRGSRLMQFLSVDASKYRQLFGTALSCVRDLHTQAEQLAQNLRLPPPETPHTAEVLAQAVRRAIEAPEHRGIQFSSGDWISCRQDVETLFALGEQLRDLRGRYDSALAPEAWSAKVGELTAVRQALTEHGGKWYRLLIGDWRHAKKWLALLCTSGTAPDELERQQELLNALLEYRRTQSEFHSREGFAAALFGAQWQGERSEWPVLIQLFAWITQLHRDVGSGTLPKEILDFLTGSPDLTSFGPMANRLLTALAAARQVLGEAVLLLQLDESVCLEKPGEQVFRQPFSAQEELLAAWAENTDRLPQIAQFNPLAAQLTESGLACVVTAVDAWPAASVWLHTAFLRSWYLALMRHAFELQPQLGAFSGERHEQVVAQFRELDQRMLQHNRVALAGKHWEGLPSMQGEGQLRVLTREFEKRSRHLPIRRLMEHAGRAVQALKPVFMMSPLSVAAYLPPGGITFDLVIFDEASQVQPVDAFGALLRAKQAVVVGDSKQLPPTRFFDSLTRFEGEADGNETADLESILGMFAAQGAPQRMLKWHYRSRHESLIATSNQEFYDNRLVVFPSPDAARETLGLFYRYHPETIYDRGLSGTNRLEAKAVAQAAMAFARAQLAKPISDRATLGVAAFSMGQMNAILAQLETLRRARPDCETFFAPDKPEPFFVKNLENVQGDERDVIYISIGYGRDQQGKIAMNFGPLNIQGGERRLNVLITRARLRCEVFTNLDPDDLDLSRTEALGVQKLKRFLAYAKTGELRPIDAAAPSGREPESPFESEVLALLESRGHPVVPQVGCAGYFIDLALIDPASPGRYLLGIECDGASYHSARTARDRDRLRDELLRKMGWRLHRVWSTDWFHRRAESEQRLLEVVEAALTAASEEALRRAAAAALPAPSDDAAVSVPIVTEPARAPGEPDEIERISVERDSVVLPGYVRAPLSLLQGRTLSSLSLRDLAEAVTHVVQVESPVHVQEVTQRIADALAVHRLTEKFRAVVESGITGAAAARRIRRDGVYLWTPSMRVPPLRSRADIDARFRQIERIAPEEISLAVQRVVSDAYGIASDQIARAAARLLGFDRLTSETRAAIEAVVDGLIQTRVLTRSGDQISLKL